MPEKFSTDEVAILRNDLLHSGLDCFQAAETIKTFVAKRGYGISGDVARNMANQLEDLAHNVNAFHQRLETLALVM